jgi:hypothetical protein
MLEKMLVVTRVLTCVNNHQKPLKNDIKCLKSWVDPSDAILDADKMARIVITKEIDRWTAARICQVHV